MKRSAAALVAHARGRIEHCDVHVANARLAAGDVVLVDVREPDELASAGRIPGSLWVPRGTLEFRADPNDKRHQPGLEPDRRIVVHSGSGERSALATATLCDMGYRYVADLEGGLTAWIRAGLPTV